LLINYDCGLLYQHLLTNEKKKNCRLIADYFWCYGDGSIALGFKGLRNRVGYLMSEQGLLRGENVRDLELPDFFSKEMDDEGPSQCIAMVIIKEHGKTNQYTAGFDAATADNTDHVDGILLALMPQLHRCSCFDGLLFALML
jgi:hypothetical protein